MPEVSFVLPCLNEAETLEVCIREIRECIETHGLDAEVIVADNGSTDESAEIARRAGAIVVSVAESGYGSALTGGFEAAQGRFLIMGDADQSYDFREAYPMIELMRAGADMVMGSRLRGTIEPGAMPWLHRWLGNPALSAIARTLFRSNISDFHCGLRGLTKQAFIEIAPHTTGMEFATEVVAKAAARGMRIEEVPVTLRPDGRSRPPHLRRWSDGWRHLRFMMTLSPRWTMLIPGLAITITGAALMLSVIAGPITIRGVRFDIHTLMVGGLLVVVGYQMMTTAVAARMFAVIEEIGPPSTPIRNAFERFTLERGIVLGLLLLTAGVVLLTVVAWRWAQSGFPDLDPVVTTRPVVVATTLVALGFQTLLMSFLLNMLAIPRRRS
jgi:hypothetical protein